MSRRATWNLTLFLAGALLVGRALVRVVLTYVVREKTLDVTLYRELHLLPVGAARALAAAAGAAALLAWRARAEQRSLARDLLAVCGAAALCAAALAGWPLDPREVVPQWDTLRGRVSISGMVALGLAFSATTLLVLRRRPGMLAGRGALVAALALLLAPPAAVVAARALFTGRAVVREVARELAFEPGSWEVLEQHPRVPPKSAVISPLADWRYDSGDLPSLRMPPPCRIAFEVRDEDGPCFLRAAAGVDQLGFQRLSPNDDPITVRFEVEVNGERVFEHEVVMVTGQDRAERQWARVGGKRGVALQPGDRVELSTAVVSPTYDRPGRIPGLPAGFGDVRLEREWRRERTRSSPETPNVVLIVMDTLRQDRLSCYGHTPGTTPRLDALAERGILYENAQATASWTWPSTASMLTGLPPETHGVEADEACYLLSRFDTLPELLSERGFATGAFSCNPLIVADKGFGQGFESFDSHNNFRRSETMIERPLEWLELHAPHRFFLYVHLVDPHAPYVPIDPLLERILPEKPADYPEDGILAFQLPLLRAENRDAEGRLVPGSVVPPEHLRWLNTVYDGCVGTADHFVGQLLDKLEELGLDDRTIVAFTSDHGEEFLDHGLIAHGNTVHRELVQVPLILAGPGLPSGVRVETPVSNRHLAPTLAKFGNARFDSIPQPIDLTRLAELPARPVYFSTHQGWWNGRHRQLIHGVRDGDWELHWAPTGAPWGAERGSQKGGDLRLYDLTRDGWQRVDVKAEHPGRAEELLTVLRAHLETARAGRMGPTLGAGGRSRELLEDIGYVHSEDDDEDPPRERRD